MDWSEWIQNVGAGLIDKRYELERLKLEQRNADGTPYIEGQPTTRTAQPGGINPMVLLIGAAVLAVVLLRD